MNQPAIKTRPWPNLEDAYRIKLRFVVLPDKRRFYVLIGDTDALAALESKPAELGFTKNKKDVWVKDASIAAGKLDMGLISRVFPKVTLKQMSDREITQIDGASRASSQEKQQSAALAAAMPIGMNDLGEAVLEGSSGRFVRKADESVIVEISTDPARFLRAPDGQALQRVADGMVLDIAEFGRKFDQKSFRRFAAAIWSDAQAADSAQLRLLQEAVESAAVRYVNRCKDEDSAYVAATAIDEGMATQLARTADSVDLGQYSTPLPISLAAQRILGNLDGKTVFEPTAGNGSLVSRAFAAGASKVFATEISLDRVLSLRSLFNTQIEEGRAEIAHCDTRAADMPETDVVIANPPFAALKKVQFYLDPEDDPVSAEPLRLQRLDFDIVLRTLESRRKNGLSVFLVGGDAPIHTGGKGGEILRGSRYFLDFLAEHYHLHECVEVEGRLYQKMGAEYPVRILVVGAKRPELDLNAEKVPATIEVLRSYAALNEWATGAQARVHEARLQLEAKQNGSIDDISADLESLGNDDNVELDFAIRFENPYQSPYVPLSRSGESETMIPRYLVGPQNVAFERLKNLTHADIDGWVATKLEYKKSDLAGMFSPEQIDALGLGISRLDRGQGFLNSDKTGVGKGRFLAAMCRYVILQGKIPVFITEKENLFSDLLRDFKGIRSDDLIKPLIINSGSEMRDLDTNQVIHRSPPNSVLSSLMKAAGSDVPVEQGNAAPQQLRDMGYNLVVCTYSQLSAGFNGKSRKAHLVASLAATNYLILDESHNAASLDSNTSAVISHAEGLAEGVVYASATFAKGAANLSAYRRLFVREDGGASINVESLGEVLSKGGESLLEAVTTMLVQDGAMVRRELDMSQVEFLVESPSAQVLDSHEKTAEAFANAISRMAYYGGDVNRIVKAENKSRKAQLHAAIAASEASGEELPPQARTGKRLGVSSANFGSRLYNLQRQLLLMLSADQAATVAIRALREGRKPVAIVEQTMQAIVEEMAELQLSVSDMLAGVSDAAPSKPLRIGVDRIPMAAPSLRDVLMRTLKRMQMVQDVGRYGKVTSRSVSSLVDDPDQREQLERYVAATVEAIMALPDLPAAPIDIFRARLQQAGFNLGEISGRGTYLDNPLSEQPELVSRLDERLKTIFDFNNGTTDAAILTRAGMTGLSLHASSTFVDQRQREMIEIQIPNNVAERVQAFGRVNRKGQVCAPVVRTVSTGLPGEARLLAMQNAKLAKLSAATTSNRSDKARMESVPDLLNWVGEKVAIRYLQDNPDIAHMLDIELNTEGEGENYFVNRLLSRLCMVPTISQQREVLADLDREFNSVMRELEAAGRNPFEIAEHDWKAKLLDRQVFLGAETPTYESEFDRPVFVDTIEYEVRRDPLAYSTIAERMRLSREALCETMKAVIDTSRNEFRDDAVRRHRGDVAAAEKWMQARFSEEGDEHGVDSESGQLIKSSHLAVRALMQQSLAIIEGAIASFMEEHDSYETWAHALEDPRCFQAKVLQSKKTTLDYLISTPIFPGVTIESGEGGADESSDVAQRLLVLGVKPPRGGKEHLFGQWEFRVMPIGGAAKDVRGVSLSQISSYLMENNKGQGLDVKYAHPLLIQRAISETGHGAVMEKRKVLSGNLYMATEYAVEHGFGTPGVYTDAQGVRQRAVVLPLHVTNALESQYIKVPTIDVALGVVRKAIEKGQPITFVDASKPDWDRGRVVAVIVGADSMVRIQCPGSKARGGTVYLDPSLRSVVANYEGQDFSGSRERMTSVPFPLDRLGAAFEALANNGYTFYVEAKHREAVNSSMMEQRLGVRSKKGDRNPLARDAGPELGDYGSFAA